MFRLIRGRNSASPVRVLVVHDCAVAAERLTRELDHGGTRVLSQRVDSEGGFLQALRSFSPDVVLVASTRTNLDPRTALQLVQLHRPVAALILVAEAFEEESAVGCLRAGAENVVLENNLSRLGPAIQNALSVREPLRTLSPRQLQVLRLVSEGLTTKQIAAGFGLSLKTVETHRGAGMRRLGLADIAGLVRYAVRVGLVPQSLSTGGSANGARARRVAASTYGD